MPNLPQPAVTQRPYVVHTIRVPKETKHSPQKSFALVSGLLTTYKYKDVCLRLGPVKVSGGKRIGWQIIDLDPETKLEDIAAVVKSFYPDCEVTSKRESLTSYHKYAPNRAVFLPFMIGKEAGYWGYPALGIQHAKDDPLTYIVQAISQALSKGLEIWLNITIQTYPSDKEKQHTWETINGITRDRRIIESVSNSLIPSIFGRVNLSHYASKDDNEAINNKLYGSSPVVKCCLSLAWAGKSDESILAGLTSTLGTQYTSTSAYYSVQKHIKAFREAMYGEKATTFEASSYDHHFRAIQRNHPLFAKHAIIGLSADEIAALWHMPHNGMNSPVIDFLQGSETSQALKDNSEGVIVGQSRGTNIRLTDFDRRGHTLIVGKAGVGKSTLLANLIQQDIVQGKGVIVIDPHGSLVDEILTTAIPASRASDVLLYDVADTNYPVPLNPFITSKGQGVARGTAKATVDRLFPKLKEAERTQAYLNNVYNVLHLVPHPPTLRDIVKFLDGKTKDTTSYFQQYIAANMDNDTLIDDATIEAWTNYKALSEGTRIDIAQPINARFGSLIGNPTLYQSICNPNRINWQDHIKRKKVVLVSLNPKSQEIAEEDINVLGAVVLAQIESDVGTLPPNKYETFLYVDEVQRFDDARLNRLFEEMRKFGVRMTVANQYLSQLDPKNLNAVLANIGAVFTFEMGIASEARIMEYVTQPTFSASDLMTLGAFRAVCKLRLNGVSQLAFDVLTIPRPPVTPKQIKLMQERTRSEARERANIKHKDEVTQWLRARYPRQKINDTNFGSKN